MPNACLEMGEIVRGYMWHVGFNVGRLCQGQVLIGFCWRTEPSDSGGDGVWVQIVCDLYTLRA